MGGMIKPHERDEITAKAIPDSRKIRPLAESSARMVSHIFHYPLASVTPILTATL